MEDKKLLFISHSEKDSNIVSDFVDLLYSIGLNEDNMFCSSRTEIGVPLREDIYDYLRNLLDSDTIIPIFMLSENYYNSPACLNEMGAVWIKQKDYFTFLLPNFEFKQIKGAINPNRKSIKLDSNLNLLKGELSNFKDEICKIFNTKISSNRWEKQRDDFIDKLNFNATDTYINLSDHQGFCIGDLSNDGCKVYFEEETNKLTTTYDFTKTTSEICSLVFFIGEVNMQNQFAQNKHLCFSLKSTSNKFELTIEMRLKNRNISYNIHVTDEWENYSIPLQKFGGTKNEWQVLKEIKFLVYRKNIQKETIEIKDLRIL